ncbi:polycystin-1-like protein 2 isoform X3 [Acropora palmata]|uniref:polycystin-1-like protein 2 isoform X3 n=1 Tax=Acropora palmata TaxID=6131 RepID=UPI003DA013CA
MLYQKTQRRPQKVLLRSMNSGSECNFPLNDQMEEFTTISIYSRAIYPSKETIKLNSSGGYRALKGDHIIIMFVGVRFKRETIITGVETQGYGNADVQEWIKTYFVTFNRQKSREEEFLLDKHGKPKEFIGNSDWNTSVRHQFEPENVKTVFIKPQTFHNNVAFRFEFYGCTMKKSVILWLKWTNESCTLEMLLDKMSDGFESINTRLQNEEHREIRRLPGVQVVKLEHLRPGSLIVELKVGLEGESQVQQFLQGMKKILRSSSKFDSKYWVVKGLQGSSECQTPNITFPNLRQTPESAVEILRSSKYNIKAVLESRTQVKAQVTWKCFHLRNSQREELDRKSAFESPQILNEEEIELKNKSVIAWEISSFTLIYGLFYVELTVQTNNLSNCVNYNYAFLRVKESPLQPVISVRPAVKVLLQGYNKELTVDAAGSFDPDEPNSNESTFEYTWLCARKNEALNNVALLPVVVPHDNKTVAKGCYGTGPGKLNFTGSKAMLFLDKMVTEEDYVITLVLKKGDRTTNLSHTFFLKRANTIGVEIKCKRNCKQKLDVNKKMAFEGICKGEVCKQTTPLLKWLLYRKRDGSVIKEEQTSRQGNSLEVKEHVLHEGEVYELKLLAYFPKANKNVSKTYVIITNESPSGGNCTVDKKEGIVLATNFTFTCFGWKDKDAGLIYQFGYTTSNGAYEIIQEGRQNVLTTDKLPIGNAAKDHEVQVDIHVKDQWGGYGMKSVAVKVRASKTINVSALYDYTVGNQSEIAKLLSKKDGGKNAMRLANTLLSVMSSTPNSDLKTKDKIKFKDEMIKHSSKVKVDDLQGLILVTLVVASATDERNELSEESQWTSVGILENMADAFKNFTSNTDKDTEGISKAGSNLLLGIGNVIDAASMPDEAESMGHEAGKDNFDNNEKNFTKKKEVAQKAWDLIGKVGESMLSSQGVGDEPVKMETKTISMVLNRQLPSDISNKLTKTKDSSVRFPSAEVLLGKKAMSLPHVDTQIFSMKQNPFSWDASAKNVKSPVVSIDLRDNKGEVIDVSGLSKEIELNIKTNRKEQNQKPLSTFVKPSVNGSMNYHRVQVSTHGIEMSLKVVPENGTTLQIYIRHSKRPTDDNFEYMTNVPDYSSCKKRFAKRMSESSYPSFPYSYFNCSKDPNLVLLPVNVTAKLGMVFIGVRLLGTRESENRQSRHRRSCSENGRQKRSEICVEFKDPPTTPAPTPRLIFPSYEPKTDVNYSMAINIGTCLYWSESKEKWTSDGCRVGPNSDNGTLQCLCSHLSAFGGDFLVAPNPIDFDKVWDAFSNIMETKNFLVLKTVCVILGLYIIAAVFARRADRNDSQKVTQVIPLGEVNADYHCYELIVYTGLWRRCGTSANVAIVLYGNQQDTDVIPLNYNSMCDKTLFARGSVNTFRLYVKESLGDISHIKLWHDNSGDNPQWFLNKVVIREHNTNTTWFFVCNRWFAAERDDGQIERVLYVSTDKEINSFKNKFYSRASADLGDGHIWLSVLTRPPTSRFTRLQRVSCCLSVLMSAMVTNAMFYQFGAEDKSEFLQIGPFILSARQFIIGIQSAVLVVPINVLIVFIFRSIRSKDDVTHSYEARDDNPSPTAESMRRQGCKLPRFFLYIGWALCILTSLAAAVFTIFYSMMWGTEVSNKWLTSILVSFTQDILFIQPMKVIIVASLLSLIIKKAPQDDSAKENQTFMLSSKVKGEIEEPLKPDDQELENFRVHRKRVLTMARVLIELVFYLMFAWSLMVICYGRRDTSHFWMTNGIDELLPRFDKSKVRDVASFWEWSKLYFVPAFYNLEWYNGKPFKYKDGFISDHSSYMVGMPRFRQLRVRPVTCPISPRYSEFRETLHPCLPPYGSGNEDKTPYSMPRWQKIPANQTVLLSEFALRKMCPKPWRYHSAEELQTLPFQGIRGIYGGGGYVADMGYTKGSAMRVIQNLQNNSWIDEKSRAVFIEFMIFDSSTRLFSAVTLLLETLPLGGVATYKRIDTMSLYGARTVEKRSFNVFCELIVVLVLCVFVISEIWKLYKQRCSYFKSAWTFVDLAQILSATATVVLSIFRRYHTSKLVQRIHSNPFETSSFHYAVLWSDLENALIAILVFILTVKVLKILKFNVHIASLAASMSRCRDKIISYSAVFLVAFLAFMQVALLAFGSTTKAYSSVSEIFRTQFGMFIGGETNYRELKDANGIIGPIYFFLFMTVMACILINMFLAILNESYREVRIYPEESDTEEQKMCEAFLHYAKLKLGRKLMGIKDTKVVRRKNKYDIKQIPKNVDMGIRDKYTPISWSVARDISQESLEEPDIHLEGSLFKDIRRRLQNISCELQEISLLPRSRKYEVSKKILSKHKDNEMNKSPCRGLGMEKISSKSSLFSLSESTMYLNRRIGRESVKRLLFNEVSSEDEDWNTSDSTSHTSSLTSFADSIGSLFGKPEVVREQVRETLL